MKTIASTNLQILTIVRSSRKWCVPIVQIPSNPVERHWTKRIAASRRYISPNSECNVHIWCGRWIDIFALPIYRWVHFEMDCPIDFGDMCEQSTASNHGRCCIHRVDRLRGTESRLLEHPFLRNCCVACNRPSILCAALVQRVPFQNDPSKSIATWTSTTSDALYRGFYS